MDMTTLFRRAVESWVARLDGVAEDQWDDPTPCSEWNVRDLVNHVVGEQRWAVPLADGATIDEVGDRFEGDLLGADPVEAGHRAAEEAVAAIDRHAAGGRVHLSYGEEDLEEYVNQLVADHVVHGWDLAVATGGETRMDPELVEPVARWFAGREEIYRSAGLIGDRAPSTGDPQADLLAAFGRRAGGPLSGPGPG